MRLTSPYVKYMKIKSVYITESYSGVMAGDIQTANKYILEELKNSYVPSRWHKYPYFFIQSECFDKNNKFPRFTVVALIIGAGGVCGAKSVPIIALWMQDALFAEPSNHIVDELSNIKWNDIQSKYDYY